MYFNALTLLQLLLGLLYCLTYFTAQYRMTRTISILIRWVVVLWFAGITCLLSLTLAFVDSPSATFNLPAYIAGASMLPLSVTYLSFVLHRRHNKIPLSFSAISHVEDSTKKKHLTCGLLIR